MDSSRILGKRNPVKDSLKGFFFENFQEDSSGILGWMSRMVQDHRDCSRIL